MPSLTWHRDGAAAAAVAQQRLARLADQIAASQPDGSVAGAPPRDLSGAPRPELPATVPPAPAGGSPSARHRAEPLAMQHRLRATLGDRLPAGAQGLRAEGGISGQHVTVVALVVTALVAIGAWWVLAGRLGEPTAVAPLTSADPATTAESLTGASGTISTAPTATTSPDQQVVVDVTGKVRTPGLVTLASGSRVADALKAAGGVRPGVDVTALNLARPLVDGEQILVGVEAAAWPPPSTVPGTVPPGTAPPAALVDVNTATLEQLDTLPGIGPVTGQAILDWRTANGSFTSVDELLEVDGIGDATLADIRDLVTV